MGVSKVAAGSVFCPTFCDFCKIKHPVSFRFGRGPQHTASPPRRRGRTAARTRKCHSDCQNAPRTQSWVSFVAIQHRSCRTPHNQRVRGKSFSVEKSRFFSGTIARTTWRCWSRNGAGGWGPVMNFTIFSSTLILQEI